MNLTRPPIAGHNIASMLYFDKYLKDIERQLNKGVKMIEPSIVSGEMSFDPNSDWVKGLALIQEAEQLLDQVCAGPLFKTDLIGLA